MTYQAFIKQWEKQVIEMDININNVYTILFFHDSRVKTLTDLIDNYKVEMDDSLLELLDESINEFASGKPMERITKETWFLGHLFQVNDNVLIPRPETEYIVDIIIERLSDFPNLKILDLCCGSGVIGLSIKKAIGTCELTLSDISNDAIENSNVNKELLDIDANVIRSDLFQNISINDFNVIISNPPYINRNFKLQDSVLKYDPHNALFTDNEGLYFYQQICNELTKLKNDKYFLAFEIGFDQGLAVSKIIKKTLNVEPEIFKDQYNCDRLIIVDKL
ncbi:MAG: peptide chain release factor N(5)-glutamine methyltransferase [Mycoplasma sp.]